MKDRDQIDLSKLLGFDAVSGELSGGVDFRAKAIEAKLGAKIGAEDQLAPVTFADSQRRATRQRS